MAPVQAAVVLAGLSRGVPGAGGEFVGEGFQGVAGAYGGVGVDEGDLVGAGAAVAQLQATLGAGRVQPRGVGCGTRGSW
jgi:hypothetical protein